jgi:hypothetical protein
MRKAWFVAGAVGLAVGVVLFVVSMLLTTTVSIPLYPQERVLDGLHAYGSATMQVHWSGGDISTVIHVYHCLTSTCETGGPEIGNATGGSGAIAVGVVGGASYALAITGSSSTVNATINLIGITPIGLVGMAVLLTGIGLIALAVRRSPGGTSGPSTSPPATP